jgi:hypothetical protein
MKIASTGWLRFFRAIALEVSAPPKAAEGFFSLKTQEGYVSRF